jgi:hypothetical protein
VKAAQRGAYRKDGNTYANIQGASPLPKDLTAPGLVSKKRLIDIHSTPWEEINKLPDFILHKLYSGEECVNRRRADEMLGSEKVKDFRLKALGSDFAVEDATVTFLSKGEHQVRMTKAAC